MMSEVTYAGTSKNMLDFGLQNHFCSGLMDGLTFTARSIDKPVPKKQNSGVLLLLISGGSGTAIVNGRRFSVYQGVFLMVHPLQNYCLVPDVGETVETLEFYCPYVGAMYIMSCPHVAERKLYLPHSATLVTLSEQSYELVKFNFNESMLNTPNEFLMDKMRTFYFMEVLGIFCREYFIEKKRNGGKSATEPPCFPRRHSI